MEERREALPCWRASKGLSAALLLFVSAVQSQGRDFIREEQLVELTLHGFLKTGAEPNSDGAPSPWLIRPVFLPGSVRSASFQVRTAKAATIAVSLLQGEDLLKMTSCVNPCEAWQRIEMEASSEAFMGDGVLWEGLDIEGKDTGPQLAVEIREPTFTLWCPKALKSKTELKWDVEMPLFVEGQEIPMELLLLNLSNRDSSHTFHGSVHSSQGVLMERAPLTASAAKTSLSRFDWRFPSPPLGLHRLAVREFVGGEERLLVDRDIAILPDPAMIASPRAMMDAASPLHPPLEPFEYASDVGKRLPMGWTTPLSRSGVSEKEQAWRLAKACLESMKEEGDDVRICFPLKDAEEGRGKGLATRTGRPKIALSMLCNLSSTVWELAEPMDPAFEGLEGFRFSGPRGFGWVLWTQGEKRGIAVQAERGAAWVMQEDGTFRNLFPGEMKPRQAWALLCVEDRPTVLLDAPSERVSWTPLVSFLGQADRVKGGDAFGVRYQLHVPEGLRLRGRLCSLSPPGWTATPQETEIDLSGPRRESFRVKWRAPWPGEPGERRLELAIHLEGSPSPLALCSHRVQLLPAVESGVQCVPEGNSVLFRATVRPLVGRPFSGRLVFQIGKADPIVQDVPRMGVRAPVEMRARMAWPPEMPRILDFPSSLTLQTEKGTQRISTRLIVGEVREGPVHVDGDWEEWKGTRPVELGAFGDLRLFRPEAEPRAATACLLWNERGLAVGARIEDSLAADRDGLDIAVGRTGGKMFFFRLQLGSLGEARTEREDGILFAWNDVGDERIYEALIPWNGLELDPLKEEKDRRISFSLGVCDADQSGVAYTTGWGLFGWTEGERPEPRVELSLIPSETSLQQ